MKNEMLLAEEIVYAYMLVMLRDHSEPISPGMPLVLTFLKQRHVSILLVFIHLIVVNNCLIGVVSVIYYILLICDENNCLNQSMNFKQF